MGRTIDRDQPAKTSVMPIQPYPRLLYISHLPRTATGGGLYTVSWNTARNLELHFKLEDPGPIQTPVDRLHSVISKFRRKILHRPSKFHTFSNYVLSSLASRVDSLQHHGLDGVFFRSSTRWSACKPKIPYFVHTDVVFQTFFHNTFDPKHFFSHDLNRIYNLERTFLSKANLVFFESTWGMNKAQEALQLDGNNFVLARNGGGITPPLCDSWDEESLNLVTIAKDFFQKGGDIVFEAYRVLKPKFPRLKWHIIGGKPSDSVAGIEGIYYEGFLRPTVPEELERFQNILRNAFLLAHPTREDTNPLVLIEAAFFGCPSISVRDFAIPELVIDGKTGFLLDRPFKAVDLARKIEQMICNPNYKAMRSNAREYSTSNFSWQSTGELIASRIQESLARK